MKGTLVNRVANSGIITVNLELYYPNVEFANFDIKDYLYMEIILKEKEFRASLKELDWTQYKGKVLLISCSADAIIPLWAYMLVANLAEGIAIDSYVGDLEAYLNHHYHNTIASLNLEEFQDKRIVIKGCGDKPVPAGAYQSLTRKLKPIALSIMYGEPCSMVPIYKKKKS